MLRRLAAGDEAAYALLYARFGERLYRTALAIARRPEDAEDAVQEVFMALVRSREKLGRVDDLVAYLFASLRRAAIRRAVRRETQRRLESAAPRDLVQPGSEFDDPRREALTRALERLTVEERTVIALKIDGALTFAEIARVLDINPNTAASRYRYALARLRGWLVE
jgi:RNA polymerase sigma-70 factor (ECF subfamily)